MATKDLSVGKPWKIILLFALPMILSVTLQQVYNIADSMIAGRIIGAQALGSISAAYPITMVFLGFATGAGVGTNVVVSRFFGMKKYKDVKTSIYTSLITFIIFSIVLGAIGILISKPILTLLKTDPILLDDANTYFMFYCFGMVFLFLYNVVTCIFQALGNSKTPLYFLLFSTTLNIALDILFAKIGLGVFGIALATLIAQGIAAISSLLWLLLSIKRIDSEKPQIYSKSHIKTILSLAIPSMIQSSIVAIGGVFVQGVVNTFGGETTAGYGAAYKICYIVVNIIFTLSNALSSYTSQNIGAGKMDRVKPGLISTFIIGLTISITASVVFIIFADDLVNLFLDRKTINPELDVDNIIKAGAEFLRVVTPFYILVASKISFDGVLKGAGDMRNFMIGTFVDLAIRVILTFVLSNAIGRIGIWWSWPIGWIIATILVIILFFTKRWKKINQQEEALI